MRVDMDSGSTAELSPKKTRLIDYGYTIDGRKSVRAERILATGSGVVSEFLQKQNSGAELTLYSSSPATRVLKHNPVPAEDEPALRQVAPNKHDFGIGL